MHQYQIYKLTSEKGLTYFGSTRKPLSERLSRHKSEYKRYLRGENCRLTSFRLFEEDMNSVTITLMESIMSDDIKEVHKLERKYIDSNECVNKMHPTRTHAEYKQIHKDFLKNKALNIHMCECGSKYTHVHKKRHERSQKHKRFIGK
jgi:predicted GIY-YIG superfamily endonuclease